MNALATLIRDEIKQNGPMSAARFMELALYAPGLGYYEKRQQIGTRGDFYTNVSVGSLFGELLAYQFARWLEESPSLGGEVQIIEAGAHDGQLASDILNWLRRHRPSLFSRLRYCIVEPSPDRRLWQQEALSKQFHNVQWFSSLGGSANQVLTTQSPPEVGTARRAVRGRLGDVTLPKPGLRPLDGLAPGGVHGIIFSNELLDAMPAHRLGWNAATRKWLEWRVACEDREFSWQLAPASDALADWLPALPAELEAVLPDGFTVEVSPQASQWWEQAAGVLRSGTLITIDYGFTQEEWIRPERPGGTLRAYSKHHVSNDLFENIGEQDITAHVNFSALQNAGEMAGLKTVGLIRQEKFLTQIVQLCQAEPSLLEPWTPERVRQFATLTHPNHLGERFRVLIQSSP